uniref:IP05150p n=1 Tax=Drosophila melanogaster TaxID=7227 RepID=Q29QJ4_DROME|nr:IP05150p [Drosophila melanogaster]
MSHCTTSKPMSSFARTKSSPTWIRAHLCDALHNRVPQEAQSLHEQGPGTAGHVQPGHLQVRHSRRCWLPIERRLCQAANGPGCGSDAPVPAAAAPRNRQPGTGEGLQHRGWQAQ